MREILEAKADEVAILIERRNRFLAAIELNGRVEYAHVHDSGRLEDILYPGNKVLIRRAANEKRKTGWDIIAGWTGYWTLANSSLHNSIAEEIIKRKFHGYDIYPEKKHGNSRIDFLLKGRDEIWLEVKGCTMLYGRAATFPDAPTERGRRYVEELIKIRRSNSRAGILFLVFRKEAVCFTPNEKIDREFSRLFKVAMESGVEFYAEKIIYDGKKIYWDGKVERC